MSNKVLIINSKDDMLEFNTSNVDEALNQYIDINLGFERGFTISRAKWFTLDKANQPLNVKIPLINGLCKYARYKIKKVITDYSYTQTYPIVGDTQAGVIYQLSEDGKSYTVVGVDAETLTESVVVSSTFKQEVQQEELPVERIADGAFADQIILKTIFIPESINYIGEAAFKNCTNLAVINYSGNNTDWIQAVGNRSISNISSLSINVGQKFTGWVKNSVSFYYYYDGERYTNGWKTIDYEEYHFDKDGNLSINTKVERDTYDVYVDITGKIMKNLWYKYANEKDWFYLDESGEKVTETWKQDETGWCYLGEDGYLVRSAFIDDTGGTCYLDDTGHQAKNTWVFDDNDNIKSWRFIAPNGYVAKSYWLFYNGDWYYLDESGIMVKSDWLEYNTNHYYFDEDGHMLKDTTITIDNIQREFDSNGVCTNYNAVES